MSSQGWSAGLGAEDETRSLAGVAAEASLQLAAFALEDLIWLVARHHQSLMTCPPLPHTHHSLLGDQERAERERERERKWESNGKVERKI